MGSREIRKYCELGTDAEHLLERAMVKQGLSARAHDRILKVARTIADLARQRGHRARPHRRGDPVPDAGPDILGVTECNRMPRKQRGILYQWIRRSRRRERSAERIIGAVLGATY